jgi:hypothetical protein
VFVPVKATSDTIVADALGSRQTERASHGIQVQRRHHGKKLNWTATRNIFAGAAVDGGFGERAD